MNAKRKLNINRLIPYVYVCNKTYLLPISFKKWHRIWKENPPIKISTTVDYNM